MAWPIDPNSKRQKIIAMLDEGPVLTSEVAAELAVSVKIASAHLSGLRRLGMVTRRNYANTEVQSGRSRMLWSLAA